MVDHYFFVFLNVNSQVILTEFTYYLLPTLTGNWQVYLNVNMIRESG